MKSELELKAVAEAAKANDAGMRAGLRTARAGVTENDIAAEIMAEGRSALGLNTWDGAVS